MITTSHSPLHYCYALGFALILMGSGAALAQDSEEPGEALNGLFQGGGVTLTDLLEVADYLDRQQSGPKDYGKSVDSAIENFRLKQSQELQIGPGIIEKSEIDVEPSEEAEEPELEVVDP